MITFNALGNEMASKIFKLMPEESTMYQYSNISLKPLGELLSEYFLFQYKTIRGFWVSYYLNTLKKSEIEQIKKTVYEDLTPTGSHLFVSPIIGEYPLEKYEEARKLYIKNMAKGKVLLKIN